MKKSEIKKLAKEIINDIFCVMITSELKEDWKKGFEFLEKEIKKLEKTRGIDLFIWYSVRGIICNKFAKKFNIGKNNIV